MPPLFCSPSLSAREPVVEGDTFLAAFCGSRVGDFEPSERPGLVLRPLGGDGDLLESGLGFRV
jgi:hypothetical protein